MRDVELLPDSPEYRGMWIPTTWRSLVESQQLDRIGQPVKVAYRLTTFGWYTGLKLAGGLEGASVRDRMLALVRVMKLRVDGRRDHDPRAVAMNEIADDAEVPRGWASNALHCMFLLWDVCGRDRIDVQASRPELDTVIIPPTFGQKHIQYDDLANERSVLIIRDFE
jgi:hypothetical protein